MILEVSPESSLAVRAAAAGLLYLHIGGGAVSIVSGAAALVFAKGSRLHRIAGNIFFVSMLVMAVIGAAVSPFLPVPSWLNVVSGAFTLYLVVTAWVTVKRGHVVGSFERGAFIAACLIVAGCITIGIDAAMHPTGDASQGPGPAVLFAFVATVAAIGDFRVLRRGSLSGRQRLVRHLWRMCYSLFVAVGSLFLGQAEMFPAAIRNTGLLPVPVLAVLIALLYWLIRIRFGKRGLQLVAASP